MAGLRPAYTRKNVLTGQAAMFIAPYNAVTPVSPPPDSQVLGTAWSSPWVPVGATEEGLSFKVGRNTEDVRIEEQMTPVDVTTTDMAISADLTFAEDTLQSMKWSFGGGTITVITGPPAKSTLTIASDLDHLVFGFEGKNTLGFARRVILPDVVSVGSVEVGYRRASGKRMYATSLRCLSAPEDILITDYAA